MKNTYKIRHLVTYNPKQSSISSKHQALGTYTHYILIRVSFKTWSCFTNKCLHDTSRDISEKAHCLQYFELFGRFVVDFFKLEQSNGYFVLKTNGTRDPPVSSALRHCCAISKCLPRFNSRDVLVRPDAQS